MHPTGEATVLPHELPGVLDRYPGIRVLSLDCFDTLLWRDCHAPQDVFSALPHAHPVQRAASEHRARMAAIDRGAQDVPIEAIYAEMMPRADAAARAAAIEAELRAEAQHCFAFAPTVALMREARRRGLAIVLVSDTYLDQRQLLHLIALAAGEDIAGLIDQVFASSVWGKPKAGGLYGDVLRALAVQPDQVLHIGDNHGADVVGLRAFGVHRLHLQQFEPAVERQLRLESAVAGMLFAQRHGGLINPQPHRAALALAMPQERDPARRLGLGALGPLFCAFDAWLRREAAALGGRVHWLFMMRDGYLPLLMHRALGPAESAHAVEISRMTAGFAALTDGGALDRFLAEHTDKYADALQRALRIDVPVAAGLAPFAARQAVSRWCRENGRTILADAAAMADRLVAHVRATVDPAPGDTLMLVDLGYSGSVQNQVGPLLAEALGVHVAGRYLLLRETSVSGLDKRGMIDAQHCDVMALSAMVANMAVLEQLSTAALGSVVDYADDGTPIRAEPVLKAGQSAVRDAVQAGCVAFADRATIRRSEPPEIDRYWREAATAAMTRLLVLPQAEEIAVVAAFQHDINLGTDEVADLFDTAAARKAMRRNGLFYQKGSRRMFKSAELAGEGLALRLGNFAAMRLTAPLAFSDMLGGDSTVPVVLVGPQGEQRGVCPARPTHDGFRALCIPLGAERYPVAVQMGAVARHVEIEVIVAISTADYLHTRVQDSGSETPIVPLLDGIVEYAPGLWECRSQHAFALLNPPRAEGIDDLMLLVVFRPLGR